jgi:hypothetical protein
MNARNSDPARSVPGVAGARLVGPRVYEVAAQRRGYLRARRGHRPVGPVWFPGGQAVGAETQPMQRRAASAGARSPERPTRGVRAAGSRRRDLP